MKIHDEAQGSPEWFALRIGKPTASNFHKILTPTGKPSKQATEYAYRLVTERLLNESLESLEKTEWMTRGKDLEEAAVQQLAFTEGLDFRRVGFVTAWNDTVGASPDRLDSAGVIGVEIKCPAPHTHLRYLMEGPGDDYKPQVQGSMLVCGLNRWHFYSYHPQMPPCHLVVERDEGYVSTLALALRNFVTLCAQIEASARKLGVYLVSRPVLTPPEVEYGPQEREPDAVIQGQAGHNDGPPEWLNLGWVG